MNSKKFFQLIIGLLVAVIVMLVGSIINIEEPKLVLTHAIVALISLVLGYILKQPKK